MGQAAVLVEVQQQSQVEKLVGRQRLIKAPTEEIHHQDQVLQGALALVVAALIPLVGMVH